MKINADERNFATLEEIADDLILAIAGCTDKKQEEMLDYINSYINDFYYDYELTNEDFDEIESLVLDHFTCDPFDFTVIAPARQAVKGKASYDEGYLIKHNDDIYFIDCGPRPLNRYEFFSQIERSWHVEDYDPEYYNYFSCDGYCTPIVIEEAN